MRRALAEAKELVGASAHSAWTRLVAMPPGGCAWGGQHNHCFSPSGTSPMVGVTKRQPDSTLAMLYRRGAHSSQIGFSPSNGPCVDVARVTVIFRPNRSLRRLEKKFDGPASRYQLTYDCRAARCKDSTLKETSVRFNLFDRHKQERTGKGDRQNINRG